MSQRASVVDTCSSSRYLQLAPPVCLSPGFSKWCSFYLEYVEKEPGHDICGLVSGYAIALQKPVPPPVICSERLLFAYHPASTRGAVSTWSSWRRSLEIKFVPR